MKLASAKTYAFLLRECLEKKFTQEGKVMPQALQEAPFIQDTDKEMEEIREDATR